MKFLNINVAGDWQVSIPLRSERQKSAAEKISQGARDGQTFVILEPEARNVA